MEGEAEIGGRMEEKGGNRTKCDCIEESEEMMTRENIKDIGIQKDVMYICIHKYNNVAHYINIKNM